MSQENEKSFIGATIVAIEMNEYDENDIQSMVVETTDNELYVLKVYEPCRWHDAFIGYDKWFDVEIQIPQKIREENK